MKRGSTTIILALRCSLASIGPLESARMVLGRIAAHDQHHVGVLDVDPAVGHRPASERWPQTGDRGAVSNPGLVFQVADPQAAHRLDDEIIEFVGIGAAAGEGDASQRLTVWPLRVLLDERRVAGLLHPVRDLVDGLIPGDVFPVIRARPPHLRLQQAPIVQDVLLQRSALRDRACRD